MPLKVARDDLVSFKNNNQWLAHHPNEALIFKNTEIIWQDLRTTYNGSFRNLVYGKLPDEADIAVTLKNIKERLSKIEWKIKIPAHK